MATTQTRTSHAGSDVVAEAGRIVDGLTGVSAEAADRLTAMAGNASEVVRDADRGLRQSSDQVLGVAGGVALGFSSGLLVSGAHRLLVILSLLPVVLVALAAMERLDGRRAKPRPRAS